MFLFPSKPRQIVDPAQTVKNLTELETIDNWCVQVKKNGCRTNPEADKNLPELSMWGRDHTILGVSREYDWTPLFELLPAPFLLDGELIGRKQAEQSNRLYLWDAPILNNCNLVGMPYGKRLNNLYNHFVNNAKVLKLEVNEDVEWTWIETGEIQVGVARPYPATKWEPLLADMMKAYKGSTGEIEGLVFKDTTATMDWGRTVEIHSQLKYLIKYA
jgi:hypothetical protein